MHIRLLANVSKLAYQDDSIDCMDVLQRELLLCDKLKKKMKENGKKRKVEFYLPGLQSFSSSLSTINHIPI